MVSFKRGLYKPKLTPVERRLFNGVLEGHEIDELNTRATSFKYNSHVSPEVIFKEHNRLVTMGPEGNKIKKYMSDVRNNVTGEAQSLHEIIPAFEYGKSPRINRSARKHYTQMWENNVSDLLSAKILEAQKFVKDLKLGWE